ncbi:MAG: hypothetical protein PHH60_04295 [Candidatus Margulisbacteria bacterium]|nr:hypothetical protein [Candidatus Margulisiibacteriota bacterium]
MAQEISGISSDLPPAMIYALQNAQRAATAEEREKVKQEFMTIFYKEMLKQSFKPSEFGLSEENNSFSSAIGSDVLMEKFAAQLAETKAFSIDNVFPAETERETGIK